jgi:hypothetical protein
VTNSSALAMDVVMKCYSFLDMIFVGNETYAGEEKYNLLIVF